MSLPVWIGYILYVFFCFSFSSFLVCLYVPHLFFDKNKKFVVLIPFFLMLTIWMPASLCLVKSSSSAIYADLIFFIVFNKFGIWLMAKCSHSFTLSFISILNMLYVCVCVLYLFFISPGENRRMNKTRCTCTQTNI